MQKIQSAIDRHIATVTSPNGQRLTTNEDICEEIPDQNLLLPESRV